MKARIKWNINGISGQGRLSNNINLLQAWVDQSNRSFGFGTHWLEYIEDYDYTKEYYHMSNRFFSISKRLYRFICNNNMINKWFPDQEIDNAMKIEYFYYVN